MWCWYLYLRVLPRIPLGPTQFPCDYAIPQVYQRHGINVGGWFIALIGIEKCPLCQSQRQINLCYSQSICQLHSLMVVCTFRFPFSWSITWRSYVRTPLYACFLHWVWTVFNGWSNTVRPYNYGWTNLIWNQWLTVDYSLFKLTSHPTVHQGSVHPNASHYWRWTEQNLKSDFHWEANCLNKPNRDLSEKGLVLCWTLMDLQAPTSD
jgi:hypothetical protein